MALGLCPALISHEGCCFSQYCQAVSHLGLWAMLHSRDVYFTLTWGELFLVPRGTVCQDPVPTLKDALSPVPTGLHHGGLLAEDQYLI